MADAALPLPHAPALPRVAPDLITPLCWTALVVGLACRLFSGMNAPLWFDETFSAVIATQPDIAHLVRWMLRELSGPTYYSMLFAWQQVVGDSNVALRLPSLILSIATPLLILWRGYPDRQVRMIWAAVTALSVIGFDSATQARPYALLFLLATAHAIAFLRLIEQPDLRRAFWWTGLSALTVLTHYHAAVICGIQGIAYLAIRPRQAIRTWPALLPLVPMTAWMAFHLPFILSFTNKDTVWYGTLGLDALWLIPSLLTGLAWPGVLLLGAMAASFVHDMIAARRGKAAWPYSAAQTALVGSGLIAVTIVMSMGFLVPSFTARYILPYVPALLAGVAFWIRRMGKAAPLIAAPMLCLMTGSAAAQLAGYVRAPEEDFRYAFNFEQPSQWIAAHGARQLVMLWDSPTAGLDDPDGHMAQVGGYFLRRDGHPMPVTAPPWPRRGDPNRLLLQLAGERPHSAILWAYDASVPGTRGQAHPWAISRIDPRWQCRDFGRAPITVLACVQP
ncbi:hypothetical protein ACFOKF_07150 [Sphingobium rhizovicinum]|uniref:Glycosyltransferase RgtA/B/C/D-like domain-containing protein n=1 Tax=Sphingobium rhizovicinum TaxID=432308 RepID=A0ABV7NBV9_9SPHN